MTATKTKLATVRFADSQEQLLTGLAYIDLRIRWAVARARANGLDPEDEFRGLYVSEAQVDTLLGYALGQHLWSGSGDTDANGRSNGNGASETHADGEAWPAALAQARARWLARTRASRQAGVSMRFDRLAQTFALTPPEVDALLIALAPELDPRYERLFAYLQDDVTRKRPSVDLVLNLLTDTFAQKLDLRRLFTDNGRLIRTRLLVRFGDSAGPEPPLLSQYLRPAAHLVEHLLGNSSLDEQLAGSAHLLPDAEATSPRRLAPDFVARLLAANQPTRNRLPLFAFIGGYGVGKREAARHLAAAAGQPLLIADLAKLAQSDLGLEGGLPLVLRDGRLLAASLYLRKWDQILQNNRPPGRLFQQLLDYPHTVITAGKANWHASDHLHRRPLFVIHFKVPDYERRLQIWQARLIEMEGQNELDLRQVANHFRFTPGQIEDAMASARDLAQWRGEALTTADLFAASRAHSNQNLATLATKIQPRYRWSDIVLPQDTLSQLREMVNTVRQRPTVYGQWGFDRKLALGKGLNALFAGESGTGKTMAADIMAGELGLDLYKIDLSALVSKYIGETEKNLDRVFSEATTSNAILFFDEADAIFGKRSEVKDSHDRYANIEISYLLQRMETYDGVVILATNLRANLDEAFTRRLHFVVEFPFPETADRERIWRVNFPPETPVADGVDFRLLAERFELAGGNIRNIILAAAFLAAESDQAVDMAHLLHAARREYQKMGRLIDERLFNIT